MILLLLFVLFYYPLYFICTRISLYSLHILFVEDLLGSLQTNFNSSKSVCQGDLGIPKTFLLVLSNGLNQVIPLDRGTGIVISAMGGQHLLNAKDSVQGGAVIDGWCSTRRWH